MKSLPSTVGQGELTDEEVQQGIAKMRIRKACGPDMTPIEVHKTCPGCNQLLRQLLRKI